MKGGLECENYTAYSTWDIHSNPAYHMPDYSSQWTTEGYDFWCMLGLSRECYNTKNSTRDQWM